MLLEVRIVVLNQPMCIIGGIIALVIGVALVFFPRHVYAFHVEMRANSFLPWERALSSWDQEPLVGIWNMCVGQLVGLGFLFFAIVMLCAGVLHYDLLNQAHLVPIAGNKALLLEP